MPPRSRRSSTAATSRSWSGDSTRSRSARSSPTCWSITSGAYVDLAFTARMEEELDEIARGERAWVPLLREFYGPLKKLVDEKRSELRRRDFTTEPSDEVCSLGHPMVIRLGRNGRFLACSLYPEHKESRPLPGEEPETPDLPGVGEVCPKCGATDGGTLVAKRGRFGPFVGCSRYPDCDFIKKDGPPPPDPLPFEVVCPKCKEGRLTPRRARRTGLAVLGLLALPEVRLHDVPRAAGRDARRRRGPGGPQGRRRRHVPRLRSHDGSGGGGHRRPAPSSRVDRRIPPRLVRPSRGGRGSRAGAGGSPRGGQRGGRRTRTTRPATGRRTTGRSRGTEPAPEG